MTEFTEAEATEELTQLPARGVVSLGRVAAPPDLESTSGVFYFWVDRNKAV